jgi:hypothetical protein
MPSILGLSRPAELDGFLVARKKWTILPRHHVGDIGKQLRTEQQQFFTLKATTEPDDALATLKISTLWRTSDDGEKDSLFFVFYSNDGILSPCRIPWQPARLLVSMATLCFEFGDSLPRSVSLLFAIGFGDWDPAEEL